MLAGFFVLIDLQKIRYLWGEHVKEEISLLRWWSIVI